MDCKKAADFVKKEWNENVIPSLMDFVRIPNVSPSFDAEWDTNGLQLQAFAGFSPTALMMSDESFRTGTQPIGPSGPARIGGQRGRPSALTTALRCVCKHG